MTPGTAVNLSTEGTTDWAHWGLTNASSFNHKSGVTAQISTFSAVGGGTAQRFDDNPTSYTWTGGTPTSSATNSSTGVYIVGLNKGFQLTVPADTTPRTVKLYVGGWGAQAKFEATLSDQSAAAYTDTSFNDSGSGDGTNRVYTLTYQAASANQTLTLTWTVTGMNDPQWGNVSLQGATLVTGSVSGALAGSLATPSATVTLSTDGTTDWAHWGLTTASSFNHKSGITAQISNYSALGGGTAARYDTNPNGYSWTDGTPTASATNSPTGLYINGLNKGFQITVPADTTSRTVKVYVGVWGAQGKLEATLSDSSASAYVDTSVTDPGGSSDGLARVYTLTYRAASANQTLTVKWTVETMHEAQWGNVTLQAATLVTNSTSGTVYQDLQYAYTADGNITTIADYTVTGGAGDQSLTYDSLDRLTGAAGPYGAGGASASITYSYDELGNLTANSQVGTYTYPTSGSSSVRPHAVSTAGSNSYTYDANGNMTGGAGRSFSYNLENKPLTITIGGQTTTFVYNGDNGRVKKVVGSTTTRYISQLYECDNTSCSKMIFSGSERVATLVPSGGIHYYHPDHLGSSNVITDGTGAKVQALTYYPYGGTRTNSSPVTPAVDVPFKYTGKPLDSSTSLYYYGARYYDPLLARFLSADTLVPNPRDPQALNRYTYAGSNPFLYTDPTGHFKIKFTKFFQRALGDIGTAVVGVLGQGFGQTLAWSNPLLGAVVSGLGTAVLTQSKTGRYTLAGEIVVASAVASFMCAGCGTTLTLPLVSVQVGSIPASATVGAIGMGTLGGISAAKAGGDISSGVLVGTAMGAASGALNGYLGGVVNPGKFAWSGAFFGKAALSGLLNMTGGAILNGASGAAIGYAGGRGNGNTMLQAAGRSVAEGAKSDFATTLLGLGFDASGPSQGFEVGWDVEPMGAIETVHHVHHFDVPASLITNMGDFFKLFGGNAPQWDELGNDKLRNQLRRKE